MLLDTDFTAAGGEIGGYTATVACINRACIYYNFMSLYNHWTGPGLLNSEVFFFLLWRYACIDSLCWNLEYALNAHHCSLTTPYLSTVLGYTV